MSLITNFLLALSVSADAFAVAIGAGISHKYIKITQALGMAFSFGCFQAIMPIIGFQVTTLFPDVIKSYDHWIAFFLLGYIGWNMMAAGYISNKEEKVDKNIFGFKSLLILGIATSIDALAVGASLTASTDNIYIPASIIGLITFIATFIGVKFGSKFSEKIGSRSEIVGGFILIVIGTKILIDHLFT
ncbi:manganese efflux pump MntP family protein [Candidatus Gracilibacteria bacterium]|nr:manganese efflux pump MntP family protein [Candidatus Gracilibacteria bacterium]